ncbi:hypothetical protein [Streptomyces acidicola]|uniref:hypothetical protein n=1 Tax=Streptomyces acidicola TaxID=2596892 RepID=UPI00341B0A4C
MAGSLEDGQVSTRGCDRGDGGYFNESTGRRNSQVAQVWLRSGLDPDAPEAVVVAVVIDPEGTPEERAVGELFAYGYEGDGSLMLVRTDGWAERRLQGEILTVEIVVYRDVLKRLDIDTAGFPERPLVEPDAVRLLRVSTRVTRREYEQALDLTAVLKAPAGATPEQITAGLHSGDTWPLILAPPPPATV